MQKVFILIAVLFFLVLVSILFISNKPANKFQVTTENIESRGKNANYKANFAIFTNGTFRIFTDPKYHNRSEGVYMQEANIITVKNPDVTWSDFFKTLPMTLEKDCLVTGTGQNFCTNETQKLRFFINDKEDINALDKKIKEGDKLLVTYGTESMDQIKMQMQLIP